MQIIESYKDLINEIEAIKEMINNYNKDKEIITKLMLKGPSGYAPIDYSGMPKGSRNDTTLDRLCEQLGKIDSHLVIHEEMLKHKEEAANKIKDSLQGLEGLHFKIAYKRIIENKSLKEIASELYLSEGYVKQLSAEIGKREVL